MRDAKLALVFNLLVLIIYGWLYRVQPKPTTFLVVIIAYVGMCACYTSVWYYKQNGGCAKGCESQHHEGCSTIASAPQLTT
jgi:hypothetical protein